MKEEGLPEGTEMKHASGEGPPREPEVVPGALSPAPPLRPQEGFSAREGMRGSGLGTSTQNNKEDQMEERVVHDTPHAVQ